MPDPLVVDRSLIARRGAAGGFMEGRRTTGQELTIKNWPNSGRSQGVRVIDCAKLFSKKALRSLDEASVTLQL